MLLLGFFIWPLLETARLVGTDTEAARRIVAPAYARDLWFTVWTSLFAAALAVAVGFWLATVSHGRRGLAAVATTVALIPLLVPHLIAAYSVRLLLAPSGPPIRAVFGTGGPDLITGPTGLLVALVWKFLPYAYLNARAARSAVPDELLQAASDLGADRWRRGRTILLPLMAPGLLAGGILVAVLAAAQFTITLVVYGGRRITTVPMDVFLLTGQNRRAEAAALGLGYALLTVTAFVVGDRAVRRRVDRDR
jgi:ABC-type Fe3+ transport system permease subunit